MQPKQSPGEQEAVLRVGRREFTAASIMALLSGVVITLSGCGGAASSSPTAPSGGTSSSPGDHVATISANHGHVAVVTSAQIMAGNAVQLDIQGQADHSHTVDLSAAEVGQVGGNQRVSKTSSTDQAHNHTVTFN